MTFIYLLSHVLIVAGSVLRTRLGVEVMSSTETNGAFLNRQTRAAGSLVSCSFTSLYSLNERLINRIYTFLFSPET